MRFKNLLVLVLTLSLLACCATVIAAAEVDSSTPASSAAPVSSEAPEQSSEPESQPISSDIASDATSSDEQTSSDATSSDGQSSGSSASGSTTTSAATSSRRPKPNVGTYTDNPDTGSDLGLASDGSFSMPSRPTSSVQTSAGNKNIRTNLLTKWLFIPVIFAALSVVGLVYVNYTAYQKKQHEMMHSDFDLSSVKRRKPKNKNGRRRL